METSRNEDNFEIDTGSRDGLQGIEQDLVLINGGKLAAWERPGTSGEEQVDGCSCHEQTVVTTAKEVAFNCGNVVIDSAPVRGTRLCTLYQ